MKDSIDLTEALVNRLGPEVVCAVFPRFWPHPGAALQEMHFDEVSRTVGHRAGAFDEERAEVPELLAELVASSAEDRPELVASDSRFHSLALSESLLRESREWSFQNPTSGEKLARVALQIARRLDAAFYGPNVLRDLVGRVWGEIANARRLCSDFDGSEGMFKRAEACLGESLDPLARARLLNLKAALRKDQRRFDESLALRDAAISIYRRYGERHLTGRTLVNKATDYLDRGEAKLCIRCLSRAIPLLNRELEPRAYVAALHNLSWALADQGRFAEALNTFRQIQGLYAASDAAVQTRRTWLKGRIAAGLGKLREAEVAFESARQDFLERDIPYDLALVSLDLALVYAREGRTSEVKELAAEMVPIFKSRHIAREALMALTLFRQAAEREALSVETLHKIIERVRQTRPGS